MKLRASSKIAIIAISLAVSLVSLGCSEKSAPGGKKMNVTRAMTVDAVKPETGEFVVRGDYTGEFVSDASAELSGEVAGRVSKVNVRLGDRVEKGDVLAMVDPVTYRQRVQELAATVELAQASVEEAKVVKENLEAELARKKPLMERNLVTEREIEDLQSRIAGAAQKLQVAKATVDQNRARLDSARSNLQDTNVRAPFGGVVAERYVDLGSYVSPSQPLFRLVNNDVIYLRLRIPEQDSGLVRVGMPVTLRVDALGGAELQGEVGRVAPALDPTTRTLRVDVMKGQDASWENVKPGMYARAQISLGERTDAVTVSNQAIHKDRDGSRYVWLVRDGKAKKQTVTPGLQGRERTEIVEGVEPDDLVVLRGHEKLRPDADVVTIGGKKEGSEKSEEAR